MTNAGAAAGDMRPYTLIAELTYRCPLRCAYCSNPLEAPDGQELDTGAWERALSEAEALGVVQVHFTGGEPLLRRDLEQLVSHARSLGLYTNLITSAIPLTEERLRVLAENGLDHVQLSIQGTSDDDARRIAGRSALARKLGAAAWVRALGLPLTLNVVLHRHNIEQVPALIELACTVGADRLELANTQYLGWALENRAGLMPSAAQVEHAREQARAARERLGTDLEIVFVRPDYMTGVPRACMDGWGRRYIVVAPDGMVLPCHQARSLPGPRFERVGERSLATIWREGHGMNAFRGEQWMKEPCRSCDRRTVDFGGCRCQAFQLTGDGAATDPACELSPRHELVVDVRNKAAQDAPLVPLRLRRLRPQSGTS